MHLSTIEAQQAEIEAHRKNGWADLDAELLTFAAKYIECGYNVIQTARELDISKAKARARLNHHLVKAFVREWGQAQSEISLVTSHFLHQHLMDLLPKFLGEEEVQVYNPTMAGSQAVKKFDGANAMKALQMLGNLNSVGSEQDDPVGSLTSLFNQLRTRHDTVTIDDSST